MVPIPPILVDFVSKRTKHLNKLHSTSISTKPVRRSKNAIRSSYFVDDVVLHLEPWCRTTSSTNSTKKPWCFFRDLKKSRMGLEQKPFRDFQNIPERLLLQSTSD